MVAGRLYNNISRQKNGIQATQEQIVAISN